MKTPAMLLALIGLAACVDQPAPQAAAPPPAPQQAAAPSSAPTPASAQAPRGSWDVATIRCSVLLGAEDDDRTAAVMFYYGYLAAQANIRVINVDNIEGNIAKVMRQCQATPDITVPDAFRRALRPTA